LLGALLIVAGAACVGLIHGLLVTGLNLQPFLVTLCGLFIYRGMTNWVAGSRSNGRCTCRVPGANELRGGWSAVASRCPSPAGRALSNEFFLLLAIAAILTLFLHFSVHGRYLYALGFDEQAARYAGIRTARYKVGAYVLCSALVGLGGVLFLLGFRSAQPATAGTLLELYAITGAVLGGCSLRAARATSPVCCSGRRAAAAA
jgi:ribose transport system permease protein